jgi:hypothetical protein
MDQIAIYESRPHPLCYTTRFLDGIKLGVHILVAIPQPKDLYMTYSLALLYEELGDNYTPLYSPSPSATLVPRHHYSLVLPPPPPLLPKWIYNVVEDERTYGAP